MRVIVGAVVVAGIALLAGAVTFAAHGGAARSVDGGVFRMNVSNTDVRTVDPGGRPRQVAEASRCKSHERCSSDLPWRLVVAKAISDSKEVGR